MRYEHYGYAVVAQLAQTLEQERHFPAGYYRRWLVEDEEFDLMDQRAGDLDHLLLGNR